MQKLPEMQPVALSFESFGQGTPVVFLHGFPFDHTIWLPAARLLENRARVILPDLRGFGSSPVTEGTYSMRLQADDVVRLLDQLEIDQAVIVGHSMGGYVALAFAHAFPGRLLGLGLISTQAANDSPERRQSRFKTAESVAHKGARVVASSMAEKLTPDSALVSTIRDLILRSHPTGIMGALKGMAERPDMTGALIDISVPAMVLAGTEDQIMALEPMRTLAQMLPKGWLVEAPGGHMLMMEHPQLVADSLNELLDKVTAG